MDGVPEDWLLFLPFAKFLLAHRCLSSSAFCCRRSIKTCVNTLFSFGTNGSSTWGLGTSALRFPLEQSDKLEHHSMWCKFMIVKPSVIFPGSLAGRCNIEVGMVWDIGVNTSWSPTVS